MSRRWVLPWNRSLRKSSFTSAEWLIEATVQELQPVSNLQEAAFQSDFGKEVRRVEIRVKRLKR